MTAQDRREFVRRPVDIPVKLSVQGRFYDGLIKNMRNGGVFIETKGRYSEGQDISMTIEFTDEKRTGKIARATPESIGVEFNYPGYTR